uniref:Uncharacterized protein n=1 Tax=Salix viminalis TaxID=40686 RepID=A0A6N2LHK0_SALVM
MAVAWTGFALHHIPIFSFLSPGHLPPSFTGSTSNQQSAYVHLTATLKNQSKFPSGIFNFGSKQQATDSLSNSNLNLLLLLLASAAVAVSFYLL